MKKQKNGNGRARESQKLTERIAELEETLRAIRMGEVDALLVSSPEGDQVFTLQGAEHPPGAAGPDRVRVGTGTRYASPGPP